VDGLKKKPHQKKKAKKFAGLMVIMAALLPMGR
jgi:hypothetical protein